MPSPLFPLVRARRLAARPALRRVVVLVLSLVTALVAASSVRAGEAAAQRWGRTRPVAVARHDLAPGDTIDGASVEIRRLPEAVVPGDALAEAPSGAVVRHPVVAGEPLASARLAPQGLTGTAALLPRGHRAMAVPVDAERLPPLATGDLVDLVAVAPAGLADAIPIPPPTRPPDPPAAGRPPEAGDDGRPFEARDDARSPAGGRPARDGPAFPLVEAVPVVAVGDATISVAVPRADAPAVALALTHGVVVVTLVGP